MEKGKDFIPSPPTPTPFPSHTLALGQVGPYWICLHLLSSPLWGGQVENVPSETAATRPGFQAEVSVSPRGPECCLAAGFTRTRS